MPQAGSEGVGKVGKGNKKEQTSNYKINKSWEYNVQHVYYS